MHVDDSQVGTTNQQRSRGLKCAENLGNGTTNSQMRSTRRKSDQSGWYDQSLQEAQSHRCSSKTFKCFRWDSTWFQRYIPIPRFLSTDWFLAWSLAGTFLHFSKLSSYYWRGICQIFSIRSGVELFPSFPFATKTCIPWPLQRFVNKNHLSVVESSTHRILESSLHSTSVALSAEMERSFLM